jgi:hypothetical protein
VFFIATVCQGDFHPLRLRLCVACGIGAAGGQRHADHVGAAADWSHDHGARTQF